MSVLKKSWRLKSSNGVIDFTPIFEVSEEKGEVECKVVELKIGDKKYALNFMNLFQFIYFCGNEELRRSLQHKKQRSISYVPYDVHFKLDDNERNKKTVTRRIQLPVDELTVFYAKQEGFKHFIKNKLGLINKGRV